MDSTRQQIRSLSQECIRRDGGYNSESVAYNRVNVCQNVILDIDQEHTQRVCYHISIFLKVYLYTIPVRKFELQIKHKTMFCLLSCVSLSITVQILLDYENIIDRLKDWPLL